MVTPGFTETSISSVWRLKGEGFLTLRCQVWVIKIKEVFYAVCLKDYMHWTKFTSKCLVLLVAVAWSLSTLRDTHIHCPALTITSPCPCWPISPLHRLCSAGVVWMAPIPEKCSWRPESEGRNAVRRNRIQQKEK